MINRLNKLIERNNKVIQAIEEGKNINIEKSIKAVMLSSNELASVMKSVIAEMRLGTRNKYSNDDILNQFGDIFGGKK